MQQTTLTTPNSAAPSIPSPNIEEEVKLVSERTYPSHVDYRQCNLWDFHEWFQKQSVYELDIETNVVEDITERQVYVIQFGEVGGAVQYVMDYASFGADAKAYVKSILDDRSKQKIIHNAFFEYTVIKYCIGVDIDNIFDTMLSLQVCTRGKFLPHDYYSLAGALRTLFDIEMSKDEQKSFDGEQLTPQQIEYAANDVRHMHKIKKRIESLDTYHEDQYTIQLENMAVRAFGDIFVNGAEFDCAQWLENLEWAQPIVDEALANIHREFKDNFYSEGVALGFIQEKDECTINWNSTKQKAAVLSELYPELTKFTKPALKVYEKTLSDGNLIELLLEKEYEEANDYMLIHHRDLLRKHDFIHESGQVLVNMNSSQQRLKMFQLIEPTLENTQEQTLKSLEHPLIDAYKVYVKKTRLVSSYGENFFDFIGQDGKIRPRKLSQILETGRISMSKPGMMTIPADEEKEEDGHIGNRYRKAFKPRTGFKLVASDYASQELAIIAYLAKEDVWLNAIRSGYDLHSVCAALVFGQKWIDAGGHPKGHEKPKTIEAKRMRTFTKTISFGLAYGGGANMLVMRLGITKDEALQLIEDYFNTFPKLREYFTSRAEFAVKYGYIETAPPFKRKRYFAGWRSDHSMGREVKASIEREGKNTSIQGTGADGSKCAMVLVKDYIERHNLQNKVYIWMMLHDAIVTEVVEDFAEEWAKIQEELMITGHEKNIPNRLILVDTDITDHWTK